MKLLKLLSLVFVSVILISCANSKKTIIGEVDAMEIDVSSKIPGRIAQILVSEGDFVKKGDALAKLESKEIDAKLKTVNAALKEAQEQFSLAQKTFNRIKNLYKKRVIAKQQYDEANYKYNAAKQKVQAVRGQKDEVMAYFDELTITAPMDGEVVAIISNVGELIATGYPVFTIMDPDDQWVVFNVREDDLKDIQKGNAYEVFFPALDETYEMRVTYMSALGTFASWKPTAQQGNYDLKTFEVRLKGKFKIENLRPGMTAVLKGAITTEE